MPHADTLNTDRRVQTDALSQLGVAARYTTLARRVASNIGHARLCEYLDYVQAAIDQLRLADDTPATPQRGTLSVIGDHPRLRQALELLDTVSDTTTTVLLMGESGTGKSLMARSLHERGRRRDQPFVEISCGALSEQLLDSELFGHVRGAFTGATQERAGRFAAANGGTIFLDEIACASPALQLKLLRVLQERQFEPVGGNQTRTVDVRIVLASNRDLLAEVRAGRFREDLYYRVAVVTLHMPSLRDRMEDLPALAAHFVGRFAAQASRSVIAVSEAALRALSAYDWPGNIRELENAIEHAVVMSRNGLIECSDLPAHVVAGGASADSAKPLLKQSLARSERAMLQSALASHQGDRTRTAAALGIHRVTLYKKLRRHGLVTGSNDQ